MARVSGFLICHFDLNLSGIRQRLDHISYLGVDAVMLSCFYDSPFEDFGRDVTDFKAIYYKYGTLTDFDKLVQELHDRGSDAFLF